MKKLIVFFLVIIGICILFIASRYKESEEVVVDQTSQEMCFYKETQTDFGIPDKAWLRFTLADGLVVGEFQNLPAMTDSKIGVFEGQLDINTQDEYQYLNLWWQAQAEGTLVTEELSVKYSDNEAGVGFAEMVDRGDGVYVYKDKENIPYWQILNRIDCNTLSDQLVVEKYIRENIGTIVKTEPTLGGSWYPVSITVNAENKTVIVVYEDGHVQEITTFEYIINEDGVVTLVNPQ